MTPVARLQMVEIQEASSLTFLVSTPESALGFRTVLLSLAESRRAFGEFFRTEFLWHASGHLAEL